MNAIAKTNYAFGDYDRITISGASYRYVGFLHGKHEFQLVTDDVLEKYFASYSDDEVHDLVRRKNLRNEEGYYSKALAELRMRQDNTDLGDLDEEDVRTMFWKREWCIRFNRARVGLDGFPDRLTMTHRHLTFFIETVKEEMRTWYFRRYRANRPMGRPVRVRLPDGTTVIEPKPFDYPNATALRNWLRAYRNANERIEAFIPAYGNCGNRQQMHPEVEDIVTRRARQYGSLRRPTRSDIFEDIEVDLRKLNAKRGAAQPLKVSLTTVNRRISRLNPFMVEAGRLGRDAALRNFAPVGRGVEVEDFLERVEIDDWTVDLFAILCSSARWKTLTKAQRKAIPRVRATVTIAIDCATRCIVGLNISETTPTTAAAKSTVRSMVSDKTSLAAYAGATSDWPMQGRPGLVVTDGGPVFKAEFEKVVMQSSANRTLPGHDPRMRGYVESVNRTMKAFCRYFTGQTFANVVERGDYNSEATASLDFESFHKAFIRFVVDKYHHRRHRGLGDITPYSMWETLTGGRRQLPMDPVTQLAVFGLARKGVRLDKHGVLLLNVSYWSRELGLLFTEMGHGAAVDLKSEPGDIGKVLVEVPRPYRKKLRAAVLKAGIADDPMISEGFLLVPSADPHFHGMELAMKAQQDKVLRAAAKAAQKKGEPFRLAAHEALGIEARRAAAEAGGPEHLITEDAWNVLLDIYKQKMIGATPQTLEDAPDDSEEGGGSGTLVAKGRPTGRERTRTQPVDKKARERRAATPPNGEPDGNDQFHFPNINEIGLDGDDE
ncbi:hypothetical protein SAMN06295905_2563 [Devosia lucknowensis]|uniref:Integrase catalytic domain-containing protein n=1 Tax=Devosia lucknowensis TaxID=1096929 RepID=A0A1Y6G5F5_9HYPH|nr:hypothetical protein [Devosia lucknowensis]SMQ85286.1 hypothetical protein SAMN06295905_2563 [Devosia lucknowensis]